MSTGANHENVRVNGILVFGNIFLFLRVWAKNMKMINLVFFVLVLIPIQSFGTDEGRIIFSTGYSGEWDLWAIRPDGKDLKQVTDTLEDEHLPSLSPGGNEILVIDAKRALWLVKSDGSSRTKNPVPLGIYAQPAWAPNGQEIVL